MAEQWLMLVPVMESVSQLAELGWPLVRVSKLKCLSVVR